MTHPTSSAPRTSLVLTACGVVGFVLGAFWQPAWQDALEPAQILAGVVDYPPGHPFLVYATKTWTVLHQVLAALLYLGCSEYALTVVMSGIMGMVSLQALGLCVYALSGDAALSIVAPAFILGTSTASGGVTYPVWLLGVQWTYGVIGLSYVLLTMALYGAGRFRTAAFFLGLAPAIHLPLGAFATGAVLLGVAASPPALRRAVAGGWRHWALGASMTAASMAIHLLQPDAGDAIRLPFMEAFGQHWDEHREPFPLLSPNAIATYLSVAVPLLWAIRYRNQVSPSGRLLLCMLGAAAMLGGSLTTSYWVIPADVPNPIPALMPSRLLNLNVMSCFALLVGLSAGYPASVAVQGAVAAVATVLAALAAWPAVVNGDIDQQMAGWAGTAVLAAILVMAAEHARRHTASGPVLRASGCRRASLGAMGAALCGMLALATVDVLRFPRGEKLGRKDPVLIAAARREGPLITSSNLHLIQVATRRPILLDGGALDALIYAPEAAPETDWILRAVYGVRLRDIQQSGVAWLPEQTARSLWESRTGADWRAIRHTYAATDILTYSGWQLQLPIVAASADLTLYGLPK